MWMTSFNGQKPVKFSSSASWDTKSLLSAILRLQRHESFAGRSVCPPQSWRDLSCHLIWCLVREALSPGVLCILQNYSSRLLWVILNTESKGIKLLNSNCSKGNLKENIFKTFIIFNPSEDFQDLAFAFWPYLASKLGKIWCYKAQKQCREINDIKAIEVLAFSFNWLLLLCWKMIQY